MAKANVLARRIRAYDRALVTAKRRFGKSTEAVEAGAQLAEMGRYQGLRDAAADRLDAFLAGRKRGPWAAYANADEAAYLPAS